MTEAATKVESAASGRSTMPFPMHSWERGKILDLVDREGAAGDGAADPVATHRWERGEMLELLKETGSEQRAGSTTDRPRVVIYMDETATEPGLQRTLGNTHAGRSVMLRYLEQARENASSQ